MLMVMRPYQITATERILNRIEIANNYKKYGSVEGGTIIKNMAAWKAAVIYGIPQVPARP